MFYVFGGYSFFLYLFAGFPEEIFCMRSFPVGGLAGWLGYTKLSDSQYGTSRTAPPAAPRGGTEGGGRGEREGMRLGSGLIYSI